MKKRRNSDIILQERRDKKALRNSRFPRVFRVSDGLNWVKLVHGRRKLDAGKKYQLNFPDNLDIFKSFEDWSLVHHIICFPPTNNLVINFQNCSFVYPECVVALASFADHLLSRTNIFIGDKAEGEVDQYLDVAGLRKFFKVSSTDKQMDPKLIEGCVPLSRENLGKSSVARKFVTLLMDEEHEDFEKTCESIGELMGNALEHSTVKQWYRIAQRHATRGKITIAIVDNGLGIPFTLRNGHEGHKYANLPDSQVIEKSLLGDVTRYPPVMGEAHGAGLERLKETAKALNADFFVASGFGGYGISRESGKENIVIKDSKYKILGTVVVLRIPLTQIETTHE